LHSKNYKKAKTLKAVLRLAEQFVPYKYWKIVKILTNSSELKKSKAVFLELGVLLLYFTAGYFNRGIK